MELKTLEDIKGMFPVIDGDVLTYRCGFAGEKSFYKVEWQEEVPEDGTSLTSVDLTFTEDFATAKEAKAHIKSISESTKNHLIWTRREYEPLENVLQIVKTSVIGIMEKMKNEEAEIYLTGKNNFRNEIAVTKEYKGNRDPNAKPKYYREIREYLIREWGAKVVDGIEADDALAIRADELGLERSVIVTNDKDLDQIAGWHYDWTTDTVYKNTPKDATFCLYQQILTGDATDNIPGLPGIGPAKARKILEGSKNTKELFKRTWDAYRAHSIPGVEGKQAIWDYMMEQAQLVYILKKDGDKYSCPEGADVRIK